MARRLEVSTNPICLVDMTHPFNDSADSFVDEQGSTWLKTGVIETDTSLYPDAFGRIDISGIQYSVISESTVMQGVCFDGTFFWTVANTGVPRTVYQYTSVGAYTGFSFSLAGEFSNNAVGIAFDGTDLWVCGVGIKPAASTHAAYKYSTTGVFQNVQATVFTGSGIRAWSVAYLSPNIWLMDATNFVLNEFDLTGVATGNSFSYAAESTTITSIGSDGTFLYALATSAEDVMFKYNTSGTLLETIPLPSSMTTSFNSVAFIAPDSLWIPDSGVDALIEYIPSAGISTPRTDTATGLPLYLRVD